jgi:hypothetical protein
MIPARVRAAGKTSQYLDSGMRLILLSVMLAAIVSASVATAQEIVAPCALRLTSDPARAFMKFGDADSVLVTPADTLLAPGLYQLEASRVGYLPLFYEFSVYSGDSLSLSFVLLANEPVAPTPEDLGLSYRIVMPLQTEERAQTVRRKYNTAAEIFAIIPLAQGIMAAIALGNGREYFSGTLMAVGVGLSVGTYSLGRVMGSRKLGEIRRENAALNTENEAAVAYNQDLDIRIRRMHAEAVRQWQEELVSRGRVEVSK